MPASLLVFVTFVHFESPRTCCRIVNNFIRLVLLVRLAGMQQQQSLTMTRHRYL